jgi:hypothetical protein
MARKKQAAPAAKVKKAAKEPPVRLFGQEFIDAEEAFFKTLPKRYHTGVRDLLNKLQLWDMQVFINIAAELHKRIPEPKTDKNYAKGM